MILARYNAQDGPVVGIGLSDEDLERLVSEGRPMSFALSDAQHEGPDASERVLVAYARPEQMEQFRNGYFPGITDARIVIFLNFTTAKQLAGGQPLDIRMPDSPVKRFVLFRGTSREQAEAGLRSVGLPIRIRAPELPPVPGPSWDPSWGDAQEVPT
jgi:hypothetical protein